jgi:hypothetical protein
MGGKSGGYDTSGLEKATKQANQLQERIYDESIARGQPFYDVGVGGLGMLADYMGIGGGSQRTEGQIRNDLMPQYTSQSAPNAGGVQMFVDAQGNLVSKNDALQDYRKKIMAPMGSSIEQYAKNISYDDAAKMVEQYGYTPYGGMSQQSVDYDGLNAAVQSQLGGQQTPDYFGSLLQSFGNEQFENDPGYQFRMDEGTKAIERQLAAQGKTATPEAVKALMEYNQGLASQSYQDAYNRYNQDQNNIYNRLAGIAGIGQQQTGQMADLGQNYATSVSNNMTNLATAQSQAQQAAAQSKGSMFGTLLGLGGQLALAPTTGGGSLIGGLF